ncbi:MAG: hypothetical protein R3268_00370 [Acidiferrobacterales bacterium]|nr:hypothetical protein [Acidiferrobacterales bacterium]
MSSIRLMCLLVVLTPTCALSQQVWDEMDVLDGPNPTLRYGFYTEPNGQVAMGRYYFIDDGDSLRVRLVPFGRTAVELPVHKYDRGKGVIELGWDGKGNRRCRLERQNDELFLGNCVENSMVMPLAIRVANRYDDEWQGLYFPVSDVDIAIIERARQILESQDRRNVNGDRNCDDDLASGRFSVFCALYVASIEIDGVYRHRRPAVQAARDSLWTRFPGEYAHMLRDINNNDSITDEELIVSLDDAHTALRKEMGSIWK